MTLLDLSLVTRSLVRLIHDHVTASSAWPFGVTLNVTPEPPDILAGSNTLGFYLYHLVEDASYRNLPPPGNDAVPVRFIPLALNLSYLLSAHSDFSAGVGQYQEQLMMGLAMKALHDYPVIDDETTIGGNLVLEPALRGDKNRLRISLQPVPPDQAVTYWTAGSSPLRLSAYYQASVILLEPEESVSRATRVLYYGVYTFTNQTPCLDGSQNTLTFTVPGDPTLRQVELRPAQVPVGGWLSFTGYGLAGDSTSLLLQAADWEEPIEVDPAWGVSATQNRLLAQVQPFASGTPILPGVYMASAQVTYQRAAPGGGMRAFTYVSNVTPFTVTPRVDSIGAVSPSGVFTVTGYIFQHASIPASGVEVYLGESRLEAGASGALNPGEFAVIDAATLEARLPAGLASGSLVPLRILVNRAESPPNWVVAP